MNAGGTLGGTGTVGNTTVNERRQSGGRQFDRHAHGQRQSRPSMPAAPTWSNSRPRAADRSNVTGAATLDRRHRAGDRVARQFSEQTYTILNAGGGLGGTQFAGLNVTGSSLSPGARNPHLTYDANNVFSGSRSRHHPASGRRAAATSRTSPARYQPLLRARGGVPAGLRRRSIDGAAECADADRRRDGNRLAAIDLQRDEACSWAQMTDPFIAGRSDGAAAGGSASSFRRRGNADLSRRDQLRARARGLWRHLSQGDAADRFEQRWSVWAAGFGGAQTTDGNAARGSNTRPAASAASRGADYRLSPDTLVGFALAGGGTNFSVANGGSGPLRPVPGRRLRASQSRRGLFAGALAYGWQDVTTDRTVTVAGIDRLRARSTPIPGRAASKAAIGSSTPWMAASALRLTPPDSSRRSSCRPMPRSVLSGANTFALDLWRQRASPPRAANSACAPTDHCDADDAILTLRGRAAWAHDFNPDRAVARDLPDAAGREFRRQRRSAGARFRAGHGLGRNEMAATAGRLAATFEGEFSNVTRSYAGKGVVRYAW